MKIITLFLTIILGAVSASGVLAKNLKMRVAVSDYAENGTSHDGTRIFLLPVEWSNSTSADLAVCLHTNVNQVKCIPSLDTKPLLSPCPDKKSCEFIFELPDKTQYAVFSIYDLDTFAHKHVDKATSVLGKLATAIDGAIDTDLGIGHVNESIQTLNNRRWTWIESLSFYVPMDDDDKASVLDNTANDIDRRVRQHAASMMPPNMIKDFESGRVSAPFDRRPLFDCAFPMPACSYEYLQLEFFADEFMEPME